MRRINYPKRRKSPYRHKVRAHIRAGRRVRSYERGKGKPPANPGRKRNPRFSTKTYKYDITFEFPYYRRDKAVIYAPDPVSALRTVMTVKRMKEFPKRVIIMV